jgi:hypothetical protein
VFWVISVWFKIRNTLPKSRTFLLGHSVYILKKTVCIPAWTRNYRVTYYELLNNERKLPSVNVEAYRNTLYVIAMLLKIYLVWSRVLGLLHELKKILFGDDILLFVAVPGLATFS